jgi:hypothetical protein
MLARQRNLLLSSKKNVIQMVMLSQHYDDATISEYCQSDFLP